MLVGCGGGGGVAGSQAVASGSLDKSFGKDGTVRMSGSSGRNIATGIACQSDGTLLVSGVLYRATTKQDGVLARLDSTGEKVDTFGAHGIVISSLPKDDESNGMAIDEMGNILLAGSLKNNNDIKELVVSRYSSSGKQDKTFGNYAGAYVFKAIKDIWANAIAVDSKKRIVVAGEWDKGIFLLRLNSSGLADNTFGTNGFLWLDQKESNEANDLVIDADDSIFVVGSKNKTNGHYAITILHATSNGQKDQSFGDSGFAILDFDTFDQSAGWGIAIDGANKLVITGMYKAQYMFIAKYSKSGMIDTGFGNNGYFLSDQGLAAWGGALTMDSNDNIIVTGVMIINQNEAALAVWRYDAAGNKDKTFGNDGVATYKGDKDKYAEGLDLCIDGNGKIVVAGFAGDTNTQSYDFTIVRFNP
jgi:uncharacterized delta-60 repeat protein